MALLNFGGPSGDKPIVLHVDDSALILKQTGKLLKEKLGFDVVQARNGSQAVELARKHKPSIILLDVTMPDMDGFQTLEALKSQPETEPIPVLMATSLDSVQDIDKAYKMGATGYIMKPLNSADTLGQKLKETMKEAEEKAEGGAEGDGKPAGTATPKPVAKPATPAPSPAAAAPPLPAASPPAVAPPALPAAAPMPMPAAAPMPAPGMPPMPAPASYPCPTCQQGLAFIDAYQAWYCYTCQSYPYSPGGGAAMGGEPCSICGNSLNYIDAYQAWYCYTCQQYD